MTCDPHKQIGELKSIVSDMEGDILAVLDYAALLEECLPGPVLVDDASGGVHRVIAQIREHARTLRDTRKASWHIVCKLANP